MPQTGTVKINLEQNKICFGQMVLLTHPLPGENVSFFLLMIVVSMFNVKLADQVSLTKLHTCTVINIHCVCFSKNYSRSIKECLRNQNAALVRNDCPIFLKAHFILGFKLQRTQHSHYFYK